MNNELSPVQLPNRLGQGTAVEQSRAVAEVQAAIVVAQQCPRDTQASMRAMADSCGQRGLAERAFYRFPRAGTTVTGPSIHLARELARCWGNVQYGINELRRDDDFAQSEMQAWAWDVQTNTRSSQTFIVPHKRDTRDGVKALTDMRDVYENNANQGARRLREAIFAILPPWFTEEATARCDATLKDGGGKPLAARVTGAIDVFRAMGITPERIEAKLGRPPAEWDAHDVAQLLVIHTSITRGEVTIADEFPQPVVTVDEITAAPEPEAIPVPVDVDPDIPVEDAPDVAEWPEVAQPGGGV